MNYLVFDVENNNTERYKRSAGNFLYDSIVAIGIKQYKDNAWSQYVYSNKKYNKILDGCMLSNNVWHTELLVGHNIKHDLLFMWKHPQFQIWLEKGGRIWDTAQIHYLLNYQEEQYPALRDIAVRCYGCKFREKLMESYWEKGIQTSDIPKELVLEDVRNDVIDTEQIFLKQLEQVQKRNILSLVRSEGDKILSLCQMEYDGMLIDKKILLEEKQKLEVNLKNKQFEIKQLIERHWK